MVVSLPRIDEKTNSMQIIEIGSTERKKIFSLSEAQESLTVVIHLCETANRRVQQIKNHMLQVQGTEKQALQRELDAVVDTWYTKIQKLGGKPKGVWLVDFDNGEGYFCWKYPEPEILYSHGYNEGYLGRHLVKPMLITVPNDENSPRPN